MYVRRLGEVLRAIEAGQPGLPEGAPSAAGADGPAIGPWLTDCHGQLNELFLVHQEALLMLRLDAAAELLGRYRECLLLHMRFEEEQLFPAYAGLDRQGRWPASLYVREHGKILELLAACDGALVRPRGRRAGPKETRRGVIALLDQERMLKGLTEHHETREERFLLPVLEAQLPPSLDATRLGSTQAKWSAELQHTAKLVRKVCVDWE
jgi:hypothetical protein